jgi:uroporphyrinogen decarboxylase
MKVAPLIGYAARVLTGTTVSQNLTSAGTQAKTLVETDGFFKPDIVFTFMDLSVEAETLGLAVSRPEDRAFTVTDHPVKSREDLDRLAEKDILAGRTAVFLETVKRFKAERPERTLAAFLAGPFSFAGILLGLKELSIKAFKDPSLVAETAEFASRALLPYAQGLQNAGADMVVLLEPTCGLFSKKDFGRFAAPNIQRLCAGLRIQTVLHVCGNSAHLFEDFGRLKGVHALSLDASVDLAKAHAVTGKSVLGNISPVLVSKGPADEIERAVSDLAQRMSGIEGFVLSTGCNLPPETPVENVRCFMESAMAAQHGPV